MKKKLADEIGKAYVRLHCSHWYWEEISSLECGSFCRGMIRCRTCGKVKPIEQLKDYEVILADWRKG